MSPMSSILYDIDRDGIICWCMYCETVKLNIDVCRYDDDDIASKLLHDFDLCIYSYPYFLVLNYSPMAKFNIYWSHLRDICRSKMRIKVKAEMTWLVMWLLNGTFYSGICNRNELFFDLKNMIYFKVIQFNSAKCYNFIFWHRHIF